MKKFYYIAISTLKTPRKPFLKAASKQSCHVLLYFCFIGGAKQINPRLFWCIENKIKLFWGMKI